MVKTKITLICLFCIICSKLNTSYAASKKEYAGTSGAEFLKIGVGTRPVALGEAYSSVADDVYALYWNPAGLAHTPRFAISTNYTSFLETTNLKSLAFTTRLGENHGVGVGFTSLNQDTILRLDDVGNEIGEFAPKNVAAIIGFGLGNRYVTYGVTGKYIGVDIDGRKGSAVALDIGLLIQAKNGLSGSFVLNNFGQEIKLHKDSDPLPSSYKLGISKYLLSKRNWLVTTDIIRSRDSAIRYEMGTEYTFIMSPDTLFDVRLGFTPKMTMIDGVKNLSLGFGLWLKGIAFDYAWLPVGDLGTTHWLSLGMKWGKESGRELKENKLKSAMTTSGKHKSSRQSLIKTNVQRAEVDVFECETIVKVVEKDTNTKQLKVIITPKDSNCQIVRFFFSSALTDLAESDFTHLGDDITIQIVRLKDLAYFAGSVSPPQQVIVAYKLISNISLSTSDGSIRFELNKDIIARSEVAPNKIMVLSGNAPNWEVSHAKLLEEHENEFVYKADIYGLGDILITGDR